MEVPRFNESDPVSDDGIERLLASGGLKLRQVGLTYLDRMKRRRFFIELRWWSNTLRWNLASDDIKDAWSDAIASIWENAQTGRFKVTGKMNAYIRTIVFRRAIDILRKRVNADVDPTADVDQIRICDPAAVPDFPGPREVDLIWDWFSRLAKNERLVATHGIRRWSQSGWRYLPTVKQIMDSVNRRRTEKWLTEDSVRSAIRRALKKLKTYNDLEGLIS